MLSSNPPTSHVLIVFDIMIKIIFLKCILLRNILKNIYIFSFLKFIFNIKKSKQFRNIKKQISSKKISRFLKSMVGPKNKHILFRLT
jgi:hypothetical protein